MIKKILITGGAGNVGGALARHLVKDTNLKITILDNLSTGSDLKLPSHEYKNWSFINSDVNNFDDLSTIMISEKFDYVFHYAAVVGVKRTLENPNLVLGDVDGIKNILELSKNSSVKRVFFSSSSEVYGEPVEIPQTEHGTPLNSRLPYAIVKNISEAYLRSYKQMFNLDYTIFRFFNTYGPLQSNDFVVTKFIRQAMSNKDITINGTGNQTRTFCYIDDNIETTTKCLYENLMINDVMNVGDDNEITILELAQLVIDVVGNKVNIIHQSALKEGDMMRRKPDITKMKKIIGKDLVTLEEGIRRVYLDFKKK
jgi:nucleoside-diphosphate-sugar epimerase